MTLECSNQACRSTGPFDVAELPSGNGHPGHRVIQCAQCHTVLALLDGEQKDDLTERYAQAVQKMFAQRYDTTLRRLESGVASMQSAMTHMRGQLASLQGRVAKL